MADVKLRITDPLTGKTVPMVLASEHDAVVARLRADNDALRAALVEAREYIDLDCSEMPWPLINRIDAALSGKGGKNE